MKILYKICGKLILVSYLFMLYEFWHLCQYGGIANHVRRLLLPVLIFLACTLTWFILRRRQGNGAKSAGQNKKILWIEGFFLLAVTVYFAGRIIYAAIPYHGALSWKVDEWMRRKEVRLEHGNFLESGAEGILFDLNQTLELPEELYIAGSFAVDFDADGVIRSLNTFLYGREDDGEIRTFLVDYQRNQGQDMTVWIDGEANADFDEDKRLSPMIAILKQDSWKKQVKAWDAGQEGTVFEILYYGKRSFSSPQGLTYLPGDADGDGKESGVGQEAPFMIMNGGEISGFEVSLHIPDEDWVTPQRYIMEPEYISKEQLKEEREQQQTESAKETQSFTVDQSDGTMYFFLDDKRGWRLVVADAAAGSRFYLLEKTADGHTWERACEDPFGGEIGVAQGLIFFDENLGFACIAGASSSYSRLYRTQDGGATFTPVTLPVDTLEKLPESASQYGLTASDYDYVNMPEKEGDLLSVQVMTEAGGEDGISFISSDGGETWEYRVK